MTEEQLQEAHSLAWRMFKFYMQQMQNPGEAESMGMQDSSQLPQVPQPGAFDVGMQAAGPRGFAPPMKQPIPMDPTQVPRNMGDAVPTGHMYAPHGRTRGQAPFTPSSAWGRPSGFMGRGRRDKDIPLRGR